MKVRIETYERGPTEVRVKNLNSSVQSSQLPTKGLTDTPGARTERQSECSPGVTPFPGMKTLGQAAFQVLKTANAARKNKTQE